MIKLNKIIHNEGYSDQIIVQWLTEYLVDTYRDFKSNSIYY